jgi:ABC-type spermidine/putrescine transport system permease subunit II
MIVLGLFIVTLIVLAIVFYKLFDKAGLKGVVGLLMLVPVVNLGVALYLAFAEWPVVAELARVKLQVASLGSVPAAVAPETVAVPAVEPVAPAGA